MQNLARFINILIAGVTFLAVSASHFSPASLVMFGFLSYLIPLCLVANLFFLVFWFFKDKKYMIISIIMLLYGHSSLLASFTISNHEDSAELKVLSYNVRVLNSYSYLLEKDKDIPLKMLEFVKSREADVVCFQEYFNQKNVRKFNWIKRMKEAGYPYYAYEIGHIAEDKSTFGEIIFSKYPILNQERVPGTTQGQNFCHYADIDFKGKKIRIYNAHLRSMSITEDVGESVSGTKRTRRIFFKKLKDGFVGRAKQIDCLTLHLKNLENPTIVCMDMNDPPYSYSYVKMKYVMKNAFEDEGNGFGFTYNSKGNNEKLWFLRIDNQFFNDRLICKRFLVHDQVSFTDHFPIEAHYDIK